MTECTMNREKDFRKSVKNHKMTIVKDDGVYRHLQFKTAGTNHCYFDLITVPQKLIITGDCGTWAFSRVEDMFKFFRTDESNFFYKKGKLHINAGYWSEKLLCHDRHGEPSQFCEDEFKSMVKTYFKENAPYYFEDLRGKKLKEKLSEVWEEIEMDVLGAENEYDAYRYLERFRHGNFRFQDAWEMRFRKASWGYIWNLYAIVWAIAKYDKFKTVSVTASIKPKADG